jgi:hypothetical protein
MYLSWYEDCATVPRLYRERYLKQEEGWYAERAVNIPRNIARGLKHVRPVSLKNAQTRTEMSQQLVYYPHNAWEEVLHNYQAYPIIRMLYMWENLPKEMWMTGSSCAE